MQTQETGPGGAVLTSATVYDLNGRPFKFTDFDGTVTFTDYNPANGSVLDTWQDVPLTGVFDPGVDSRQVFNNSAITTNLHAATGDTDQDESTDGTQTDGQTSSNAGLTQTDTSDGQTSRTVTKLNTPAVGDTTVITTNPDGTKVKDEYDNGLLADEKTLGTDGSTITDTSYGYDALGRNTSVTDWTGTTTFTLRLDGSVQEVDYPDGRTQTVDDTDPKNDTPTQVTLKNGQTQSQTLNPLGQQTSQSGEGVLPARYAYDANTGSLTSLKLFQSGTLDSGTAETTTWAYDPATGMLDTKTYSDGTQDVYSYNSKFQLSTLTKPGVFSNYTYDSGGRQTSSSATDTNTDSSTDPSSGQKITTSVGSYDDQGRPTSITQTTTDSSNNVLSTATNNYAYDAQGNLKSESGTAGVATVYDYYAPGDTSANSEPGALKDEKLMQGTTTLSETDYQYDPTSKRLKNVIVNGQTFTYAYKSGTNLVLSITAGSVVTTYGYEPTTGRLSNIGTADGSSTLYAAGYTYTQLDQQNTAALTQVNADGSTTSTSLTYGYDAMNELTSAAGTMGGASVSDTYSYDGAGNRNDSGYVTQYGTADTMNQLSNLTYNPRGDVTDDGTYTYTWNALDEMTSEAPDSPTTGSQKLAFLYDANQHRIEKDIFNWNGTAGEWDATADGVLRYAYVNGQLAAEFNGSNQIVESLSRGAGGTLLAVTYYSGSTPVTYSVEQDATGSTAALFNPQNGTVGATFRYGPTGQLLSATGPAVSICPELFAGMIFDGSAALPYYAWHRYYSPALDKWLSRDPMAETGGLDTTEYAGNDPINRSDPKGLESPAIAPAIAPAETEVQMGGPGPGAGAGLIFGLVYGADQYLYYNWPAYQHSADWANTHLTVNYVANAVWDAATAPPPQSAMRYRNVRPPRRPTPPATPVATPVSSPAPVPASGGGGSKGPPTPPVATGGAPSPEPSDPTFRNLLTPSEQAEFEALRAKYRDWMPANGLDTPATVRSVEDNAMARSEFTGRGHHPTPLKYGGEPNPPDLKPTGETQYVKNPIHTEITNFWNRVLRRINSGTVK